MGNSICKNICKDELGVRNSLTYENLFNNETQITNEDQSKIQKVRNNSYENLHRDIINAAQTNLMIKRQEESLNLIKKISEGIIQKTMNKIEKNEY